MSKLQHTPGPWKYTISKNSGRHQISDAKCGGQVCAIWSRGKDITESNARLITAAPEMLEALITTYKAFNTDGHEHDCGQPCEGSECFSYCPNIKIKQAIEKATGMSIEEILK